MICDLDTKMWSDPWFESLKPNAKLLFIYLWTNNHKNLPCLYEITISTISNETGFKPAEVKGLLRTLHPKVIYIEEDNLIWVVNSVRRQFLKSEKISTTIIAGINKALLQLSPGHPLIGEFLNKYNILEIPYRYPIEGSFKDPLGGGAGENGGGGKGKDLQKSAHFIKPTLEQVEEYCKEQDFGMDPQAFMDYFKSNGWKVGGKAPMKDWKASVRNWERRENKPSTGRQRPL